MIYKRFNNHIFAKLVKGDEILSCIKEIIEEEKIDLAIVSAIGAINKLKAGLFLPDEKTYIVNEFNKNMEIVSLTGNITKKDKNPYIHIHISASDANGNVIGGHLNEAFVSLTCELEITIIEGMITRVFDKNIGLNVFDF